MNVIITDWGLQSYLDIIHQGQMSRQEYVKIVRPDVELLKVGLADARFRDPDFWGPAESGPNAKVPDGFKMKWKGRLAQMKQMRLAVAIVNGDAFLCQAYNKTSPSEDYRNGAKLKKRIDLIRKGQIRIRGRLP